MGLLDKAQPTPQQAPDQQSLAQQEGQKSQPGKQLDHQEIYDRIATMAINYVSSEQGLQMVSEGLKQGDGDIIKNAGNIVAQILMRLIIAARTAGGSIPPKVMMQVGMEVSLAVMQIADADQSTPQVDKRSLDNVFYVAVDQVGSQLPQGVLSAQERQEVQQTLQQIQQNQGQASQGRSSTEQQEASTNQGAV